MRVFAQRKCRQHKLKSLFPDHVEDDPKEGKTERVAIGPTDEGVAHEVVVSASSGVGSGNVNVARAKVKPIDGGSKRSRISAPEGVSEEVWGAMSCQQRQNWRNLHQTGP